MATLPAMIDLRSHVRDVPDFPKPGIVFKDLMPLVADAEYFRETIDRLEERWSDGDLLLQICADDRLAVSHAQRVLLKAAR